MPVLDDSLGGHEQFLRLVSQSLSTVVKEQIFSQVLEASSVFRFPEQHLGGSCSGNRRMAQANSKIPLIFSMAIFFDHEPNGLPVIHSEDHLRPREISQELESANPNTAGYCKHLTRMDSGYLNTRTCTYLERIQLEL